MTKSPKLPINVRRGSLDSGRWYLVDGDEIPLDLGGHLGQVVVDALTADAEWVCPGCVDCGPPIMVKADRRCGKRADAEKEERDG